MGQRLMEKELETYSGFYIELAFLMVKSSGGEAWVVTCVFIC